MKGVTMYTISFDETTGFEKHLKNKAIPLIGGLIYDHGDDKAYKAGNGIEVESERVRIIEFLRLVCDTAGTDFPEDLHVNNKQSNLDQVSKTKKETKKHLAEFLCKGTYNGKNLVYVNEDNEYYSRYSKDRVIRRKGKYHISSLILSDMATGEGAFFKDGIASNTYISMVEDMILKMSFLNIKYIENGAEVAFDIPTRVVPDSESKTIRSNYIKLGYKYNKDLNRWHVIEAGDIKQIIKHADKDLGRITINRVKTDSIGRGYKQTHGLPYDYAFLFLSDIICEFLEDKSEVIPYEKNKEILTEINKITGLIEDDNFKQRIYEIKDKIEQRGLLRSSDIPSIKATDDVQIKSILKKWKAFKTNNTSETNLALMNYLTGGTDNLLFYYGNAGSCYNSAVRALVRGDIFDALCSTFDGRNLEQNEAVEYYVNSLFPEIEDKTKECSIFELRTFIEKVDKYRFSTNLNQRKLVYLYKHLLVNAEQKDISMVDRYTIQDIGVSAFTHIGDIDNSTKCYQECKKIHGERYVDDITFSRTVKRRVSGLIDTFDFESAEIETMLLIPSDWSELLMEMDASEVAARIDKGVLIKARNIDDCKSLSILGQIYAQMRDSRAELCFLSALKSFEDIREPDNWNITLSFYLHYLIDSNKKSKYEEYAEKYFGYKDSLESKLNYILEEAAKQNVDRNHPATSFGFAMYAYIKAFYYFYIIDKKNNRIANDLVDIEKLVRRIDKDDNIAQKWMSGHPWEIILKYSALISLHMNANIDKGKNLIYRSKVSVGQEAEAIIQRIYTFGEIEFYNKMLSLTDSEEDMIHYEDLIRKLLNDFDEKYENTEQYTLLSKRFHYMYR